MRDLLIAMVLVVALAVPALAETTISGTSLMDIHGALQPGQSYVVMPGVYAAPETPPVNHWTAYIEIPAGVTLRCMPGVWLMGGAADLATIGAVDADDVTIIGCSVDGGFPPGTDFTSGGNQRMGVYIQRSDRARVIGVHVENICHSGLYFQDSDDHEVLASSCKYVGRYGGVPQAASPRHCYYAYGKYEVPSGGTVRGLRCEGVGSACYRVKNTHAMTLDGMFATDSEQGGPLIVTDSTDVLIENVSAHWQYWTFPVVEGASTVTMNNVAIW